MDFDACVWTIWASPLVSHFDGGLASGTPDDPSQILPDVVTAEEASLNWFGLAVWNLNPALVKGWTPTFCLTTRHLLFVGESGTAASHRGQIPVRESLAVWTAACLGRHVARMPDMAFHQSRKPSDCKLHRCQTAVRLPCHAASVGRLKKDNG